MGNGEWGKRMKNEERGTGNGERGTGEWGNRGTGNGRMGEQGNQLLTGGFNYEV